MVGVFQRVPAECVEHDRAPRDSVRRTVRDTDWSGVVVVVVVVLHGAG